MESLWFHPDEGQDLANQSDTATSAPLSRNIDSVSEIIQQTRIDGKDSSPITNLNSTITTD